MSLTLQMRKLRYQSLPQDALVVGSRIGVCIWSVYLMLLPKTHAVIALVSQISVRMLIY